MSDSDSSYEPEYEPEEFQLPNPLSTTSTPITIRCMTVLPPPIEHMVKLRNQNVEISGQKVWTGSFFLANYLISMHQSSSPLLKNKSVMELGAGSGILSILASSFLEASFVTASDNDPVALDLLSQNLILNDLHQSQSTIQTASFSWGTDPSKSTPPLSSKSYDVVVAGDVMYKDFLPDLFFKSVCDLLNPVGGKLFLCHVPRAGVDYEVVVAAALSHGIELVEITLTVDPHVWEMLNQADPQGDDLMRAKIYTNKLNLQ